MNKTKTITKIILYALVLSIGISILCFFTGCKNKTPESDIRGVYLEVSDNQGNRFYLGKDSSVREKDLVYEYSTRVLRFKTKVYYDNGEQFIPSNVIGFDQKSIPLNKAGTYNLSSVVVLPTGSTFFNLKVTVKEGPDERPVPVIEILPDDKCIEYELNKRYVYKYDGEFHLPKKYNAYDPEFEDRDHPELRFLIMTSDVIGSAVNGTVVKGDENCEKFVDVGIYKFDLYVYNPLDRFAPAQIRGVIVEIVE